MAGLCIQPPLPKQEPDPELVIEDPFENEGTPAGGYEGSYMFGFPISSMIDPVKAYDQAMGDSNG